MQLLESLRKRFEGKNPAIGVSAATAKLPAATSCPRILLLPSPFATSLESISGRQDTLDDIASEAGDSRRPVNKPSEEGASGQFLHSLDNVTKSFHAQNTNAYFVFCLKPNDRRIANQFDSKCVRTQMQTFGIAEISQRIRSADFSVFLPFGEFLGLADVDTLLVGSEREKSRLLLMRSAGRPMRSKLVPQVFSSVNDADGDRSAQ
ncbi:hypothetical protein MCOR02_012480 [Pyricularia oryzae]|nr:hypothetical protein MCOR02_012480 [Pyricularia oryzae]